MRLGRLIIACLVLLPAWAGCLGADVDSTGTPVETGMNTTRMTPGVVVASIDRGWNPYHEVFRRPGWTHHPSEAIPGFPADAPALPLTLGDDHEANLAADAGLWEGMETGQVYWVPGTNVLLMQYREWTYDQGASQARHGTAASHAASAACPECYVLAVIDPWSGDGESIRAIAEDMPWVDFVSMTSIPVNNVDAFFTQDLAHASRALWDAGGLFFAGAGNNVVNADMEVLYRGYSYPPWTVMVGGAHGACSGTDALGGKPTEFVGDFTQELARPDSVDGVWYLSGTSFATPQLAGFFGRALLEVRAAHPEGAKEPGALWVAGETRVTQEDLRAAFAGSARYFAPTEFDPSSCPPLMRPVGSAGPAVSSALPASATPWVEMGWGYVGEEEALFAADVVLGDADADAKPAAATLWMDAFHATRASQYPW